MIHVKYSGVCHTDLHAWKGDWPLATKLPLVGGHEGAGVVVGMGENVKGWKIGDFAGIKWLNGSCMSCEFCQQGAEPNCGEADCLVTLTMVHSNNTLLLMLSKPLKFQLVLI